ncbi:hypothetical protein P3T86_13900 (plasmid) [Staphylococcus nepalensis]|uniref:hypothetical protein n=1 Tax=Staphylococcus nepalensis TaxID=214473 RepID=UPI002B25A3BC|nr:hypothetical protein [Staphylococcus nepalensis]WQL21572.1 hypothetical protein P3T86_13900 [Staphylococcus nepalensis]
MEGLFFKDVIKVLNEVESYISNDEKEEFQEEEPLSSEIELSSFTNYIVSKFIELCANFTNNRQLWLSYKQQFEEYCKNKWNS